jgi:hypothetical protein
MFKIALPPTADAELHLADKKYPTETEAADAVKRACEGKGVRLKPETREDNCIVLRNEDGGVIARVVSEPEPKWRKQ